MRVPTSAVRASYPKGSFRRCRLVSQVAEREGFEPSIRFWRILTFQASAFDHSATAPHALEGGRSSRASPSGQGAMEREGLDALRAPVSAALTRGRDSNPRYAFGVYSLSRRAPSTTRPPLRMRWKEGDLVAPRHQGKARWSGRDWTRFARPSPPRSRAAPARTLDTLLAYTHFPGERLRPLGHRSACAGRRAI